MIFATFAGYGAGGFAGAVGGMLVSTATGLLLQATGSYVPLFLIAGSAYLVALLVVHLLVPGMQPAQLEPAAPVRKWSGDSSGALSPP